MGKVMSKVAGITMALVGLGLLVLCGYLIFTSSEVQWLALIAVAFFGLMLILSGWSILAGEKLSDVLRYLFTGFP